MIDLTKNCGPTDLLEVYLSESETDSSEFKQWFGNSQVVDSQGNPLVVYHGSIASNLKSFDRASAGKGLQRANSSGGFYFSSSREVARNFSELIGFDKDSSVDLQPDDIYVYGDEDEWYLHIESLDFNEGPFDTEDEAEKLKDDLLSKWGDTEDYEPVYDNDRVYSAYLSMKNPLIVEDLTAFREAEPVAESQGFDGIIAKNIIDGGPRATTYIVFDSTQIKSTTNNGNFDPNNPNINEAEEETPPAQPKGVSQSIWNSVSGASKDMLQALADAAAAKQTVKIYYYPKITKLPNTVKVYRSLEPYSIRWRNIHINGPDQPTVKTVVFFGYDRFDQDGATIKMFVMDNIKSVEYRSQTFSPRWDVEFGTPEKKAPTMNKIPKKKAKKPRKSKKPKPKDEPAKADKKPEPTDAGQEPVDAEEPTSAAADEPKDKKPVEDTPEDEKPVDDDTEDDKDKDEDEDDLTAESLSVRDILTFADSYDSSTALLLEELKIDSELENLIRQISLEVPKEWDLRGKDVESLILSDEPNLVDITVDGKTQAQKIAKTLYKMFGDAGIAVSDVQKREVETFINSRKVGVSKNTFELSDDIFDAYQERGCRFGSCMWGGDYIEFYEDIESEVKILRLKDEDGETIGRSLVWMDVGNINVPYMDRPYPQDDEIMVEFGEYAAEQGWYSYVHEDLPRSAYIETGSKPEDIPDTPYMDTFKYGELDEDGNMLLSMIASSETAALDSQSGGNPIGNENEKFVEQAMDYFSLFLEIPEGDSYDIIQHFLEDGTLEELLLYGNLAYEAYDQGLLDDLFPIGDISEFLGVKLTEQDERYIFHSMYKDNGDYEGENSFLEDFFRSVVDEEDFMKLLKETDIDVEGVLKQRGLDSQPFLSKDMEPKGTYKMSGKYEETMKNSTDVSDLVDFLFDSIGGDLWCVDTGGKLSMPMTKDKALAMKKTAIDGGYPAEIKPFNESTEDEMIEMISSGMVAGPAVPLGAKPKKKKKKAK